MRYCFLTTGSWRNNTMFMRFRELGKELASRGVEVNYVVEDLPGNEDADLNLPTGTRVHRTPLVKGLGSIKYRRNLLKNEVKADFVHVLNVPAKSVPVLIGSGQRVVSDWDEWTAGAPIPGVSIKRRIHRFVDSWYRRKSDRIVVCSRYLQRTFGTMGAESAYIPYAVFLPPQPMDAPSPFAEPTGVYMGNLYSTFDQDLLFHAMVILRGRGVHPPIRFVGRGPELEKWTKFVEDERLANVKMMGYLPNDEMFQYLRHAHVLLFPIRENLTNLCRCPSKAYAFAQAHRPVITNRVGEVPEVLGEAATYIDATPQGFADAIEAAFAKPSLPDVDYGIERHNWSARADDLLKCLG
jgi:glycosyltransferase involved in cell wall biosynthesis